MSGHGDRRMPISLDHALQRIVGDGLGILPEGKLVVDCISEQFRSFLHLSVPVGWNINKEILIDLPSLEIFQSIHQHPHNSKNTGYNT